MDEKKVVVLGGGPGAHATAADLALRGFQVSLYDLPEFADGLKRTKEIGKIELTGQIKGVAKVNLVTTDIKEALRDVGMIFVVARSNAHSLFADACAPYVEEGQVIVFAAGNCGSLVFANVFREKEIKKDVMFAEMHSLPYGCRFREPTSVGGPVHVRIFFTAPLAVGVFPARRTDEVIARIKKYYPDTIALTNVLEAAMNAGNPMVHVAPTLLNIGRIERVDDFKLFYEGFSESVVRVVMTMFREKEAICQAFGLKVLRPTPETTKNFLYYRFGACKPKEGVEEIWQTKQPMEDVSKARYITEDVPYGLAMYSSFGKLVGVKTLTIDSVIQLASVINRVDYMAEGRTAEELGLSGLNVKQINDSLYQGW